MRVAFIIPVKIFYKPAERIPVKSYYEVPFFQQRLPFADHCVSIAMVISVDNYCVMAYSIAETKEIENDQYRHELFHS